MPVESKTRKLGKCVNAFCHPGGESPGPEPLPGAEEAWAIQ